VKETWGHLGLVVIGSGWETEAPGFKPRKALPGLPNK